MNTFGLTKKKKKLLKIAKATGLSIVKLQPSAPIIKMMVSGDPDALKHHVKWCKLTKSMGGTHLNGGHQRGPPNTPTIDALFNLLFKRSDCGGIECLAAWEELSRKNIKPPPYKMCSEKAALQVEDEDEMPNAWASPYDTIRKELLGASAPMV